MLSAKKKILVWFVSLSLVALVAYSLVSSVLLVKNFEKIEQKEFTPEASSIEISQRDADSHKRWDVKARKGISDQNLSKVSATGIQTTIYDKQGFAKIFATADKAEIDKDSGEGMLSGHVKITIAPQQYKSFSEGLSLNRDKPILLTGGVVFFLDPDGNKQLRANNAIIAQDLSHVTLLGITQSPVGSGLTISGNQMDISLVDNQITSLTIDGNVSVISQAQNTRCTSQHLTLKMMSGEPRVAVFTGAPRSQQNGKILRANRLEYMIKENRFKAFGNVHSN